MRARRISAVLCLVGAVLIAVGVVRHRWWTTRVVTPDRIVDVRIGLTGLTGCTHDQAGVWRCESVEWDELGVTAHSAMWVWSGRLLYGVGIAAALALAAATVIAGIPLWLTSNISPARLATVFTVGSLLLMGLYRITTPEEVSVLLSSGSGWWLTLTGVVVGGIGAVRELRPPEDE